MHTGVVAAGHPLTAQAGARVLREGGNAVDAAVAAMLTSFAAEPLLTGLGAGGYMLVAGGGRTPMLLDFFVQAPSPPTSGSGAALEAIDVSFGDAAQVFHIGPASCGVYGTPAGVCEAVKRWGSVALSDLAAPAARLAREGVMLNAEQAYVAKILAELLTSTPECAALWAPEGRVLRRGELLRNPELGDSLELLGHEGPEPFYAGDVARKVCDWLGARGASLGADDLAGYRAISRAPVRMRYRDRDVLTNPPPSAGGTLIAYALGLLDRRAAPPSLRDVVDVMAAAQGERTADFVEGLADEGFLERFLSSRLGATTHISVLDRAGCACSATVTNGEGSGVVVPGTGIHLNNVMGEEDLNPLGFHRHPAGRRMPSMMAPSLVLRDGEVELVLGSAGSNRIRSAILQTIVAVVDHSLGAREAVEAPRVHFEGGVLYIEPGIDERALAGIAAHIVRFGAPNLFFGGVQAVLRRGEKLTGAGDPRRGRRRSDGVRPLAACAAAGALLFAGCGGVRPPDLFIVQRSGTVPGASLTLVVDEEGGVRCNGRRAGKLGDPQIIEARTIQEDLQSPSARRLSLAPGPQPIFSYRVRDESGSVSFSDDSSGQPAVLHRLALFVLQTAQHVCRLPA